MSTSNTRFKEYPLKGYTDIMIDIETLSTKINAIVVEIACVPFNSSTKAIAPLDKSLILRLDAGAQQEIGRHICINTIEWWLSENDMQLKRYLQQDAFNPHAAVASLSYYLSNHPFKRIWSKSPSFDLAILQSLCVDVDEKCPWLYYQERDVRNCTDIFPTSKPTHDPYQDAVDQIESVQKTVTLLTKA